MFVYLKSSQIAFKKMDEYYSILLFFRCTSSRLLRRSVDGASPQDPLTMADFMKVAKAKIDAAASELNALSQDIWSHPELNFNEHHAHEVLTDFLEKEGFNVERHFVLETAFRWATLYKVSTLPCWSLKLIEDWL